MRRYRITGAIVPKGTEINLLCRNQDCPEYYSEVLDEDLPSDELDVWMLDADYCQEWDKQGYCPNCKQEEAE